MKHTKGIDDCAILHKQVVEMANEATINGLGKEDIQHNFYHAWVFVFKEGCLELDGDGLFGVRDTTEELKDAEEEDSDFTGGNVDGATGLVYGLNKVDVTAIDTEEELVRGTRIGYNTAQSVTV